VFSDDTVSSAVTIAAPSNIIRGSSAIRHAVPPARPTENLVLSAIFQTIAIPSKSAGIPAAAASGITVIGWYRTCRAHHRNP
jgi:hypothetical protein